MIGPFSAFFFFKDDSTLLLVTCAANAAQKKVLSKVYPSYNFLPEEKTAGWGLYNKKGACVCGGGGGCRG